MAKVLEIVEFSDTKFATGLFSARRELRMALLLALILSWASLVLEMDKSGTLANFLSFDTLMKLERLR